MPLLEHIADLIVRFLDWLMPIEDE